MATSCGLDSKEASPLVEFQASKRACLIKQSGQCPRNVSKVDLQPPRVQPAHAHTCAPAHPCAPAHTCIHHKNIEVQKVMYLHSLGFMVAVPG